MLKLLCVFMGLFLSTSSFAEETQTVYLIDFYPNRQEIVAIPLHTITKIPNGHVRTWVFLVNKNKKIPYDMQQMYLDFNYNTSFYQGLQGQNYLKGKFVGAFPGDSGGYVAPGSIAEGVYKFVCAYDKNTPTYLLPYPENFKEVSLNMAEMVTKLQEFIVGISKFVK